MKNNSEYKVVNYFVQHKTGDTWIQPYVNAAKTYRQMKQSAMVLRFFVICFFVFLVVPVPLQNDSVAKMIAGYLWGASVVGMLLFGLGTVVNFFEHIKCCKDDGTIRDLLEHLDSFRKLFGKYPGQLGRRGVAKKLVKQVKKILALEAKKRDTYRAHEHLRKMFDTAKMFVPVNRYEELFATARAGEEIPPYVPAPED